MTRGFALRGIVPSLFLLACGTSFEGAGEELSEAAEAAQGCDEFVITSPAFEADAAIPDAHTCNAKPFGAGVSPALEWTKGPHGTKSYAIVFKDISLTTLTPPDNRGYHWVIWDIPKHQRSLPEALGNTEFLGDPKKDARQWSRFSPYGYLGPCPNFDPVNIPVHTDTYSFTLYALEDKIIELPAVDPLLPNYTRVMSDYLETIALEKTELIGTSEAIPSAPPVPPGPPPAPAPRP